MRATIVSLPGDGIGPEIVAATLSIIDVVNEKFDHEIQMVEALIGGAAIDATGEALPAATRELCQQHDAVLLGAVGGPKWSAPDAPVRPEQGLLDLRSVLGVYANLRPVKPYPALFETSPIRSERLENTDILVVRELTGGIYFGDKTRTADSASDTCLYTRNEIERIVRRAAVLASSRQGRLVSVDKANVLETSRLWREVVEQVLASEFPEIEFEHLLVDAAAMHLIDRPASFDVIVTENMFGDILTDEASMLAGSLGLLPSASLGDGNKGLYEPIHGSAPDIAGQKIANPCATIASLALLLRHSFALENEALAIEAAIEAAVEAGARTADIAGLDDTVLNTDEMAAAVSSELSR